MHVEGERAGHAATKSCFELEIQRCDAWDLVTGYLSVHELSKPRGDTLGVIFSSRSA
mgnify:CR=1 FL=1